MNFQAFCYVGLLRFPEQLEPALALLSEAERATAMSFFASVKDLPKPELLQRWSKLRDEEYAALCQSTYEQTGIRLEVVPPSLQEYYGAWLADKNG